MKKFSALLLVFIMFLGLCSCNSTKLTAKNIVGTWEAEFTMKDYAAMTGEDITTDTETELPKKYSDKMIDLTHPFRVVYYENGTCDTKMSKSGIDKFYSDNTDILMEYYEDEGLLLMYQTLGATVKTNDELATFLAENGSTFKEVLDALEVSVLGLFEKAKKEFIKDLGNPDKDGYYTANKKPEKFTVNEDSITIITEKDKEEITYCKLTDKNTLVVNKIYYDYEESEVNITFKRVK